MPKIAASKPAIKAPRRCEPVYRVRNWAAYEAGLKQRGSLTFWITPQALRGWYHQGPTQRGRQNTFSDLAIQTALMLRLVYALPLRQTEGFLTSILALMGGGFARARSHDPLPAPGRFERGFTCPIPSCADPLGGGFHRPERVWRRGMEGASTRLLQAPDLAQIAQLKPNYAGTSNALGGSCVREIRRTKKRKRGWDVRYSIA